MSVAHLPLCRLGFLGLGAYALPFPSVDTFHVLLGSFNPHGGPKEPVKDSRPDCGIPGVCVCVTLSPKP